MPSPQDVAATYLQPGFSRSSDIPRKAGNLFLCVCEISHFSVLANIHILKKISCTSDKMFCGLSLAHWLVGPLSLAHSLTFGLLSDSGY